MHVHGWFTTYETRSIIGFTAVHIRRRASFYYGSQHDIAGVYKNVFCCFKSCNDRHVHNWTNGPSITNLFLDKIFCFLEGYTFRLILQPSSDMNIKMY